MDTKKLLDAIMGGGATPGAAGAAQQGAAAGGLGDMLGQVATELRAGMQEGAAGKPLGSGSFASIIGQVLGAATSGLQTAARDVEAKTGIGGKADQALKDATGSSAGDLLAKARDLASQNKLGAGAALGGLAAILLGTGAGRGIAASTARLGGLAVIGGLAYKAWENYQAGKPLIDLGGPVAPAPDASPFGETADHAQDQATALLMVRAMIAAASADGVVDEAERRHIVGGLGKAASDTEAAAALAREFAAPLSVDKLVAAATTPAVAAQVYTAARLAINPDNVAETAFLARLAAGLKLDPGLVQHLDAVSRNATTG